MKINEKLKSIMIAIVSFGIMVSIAAFLNYKYNPEREKDLGQTVYVSSNTDQVKIYENEVETFNKEKGTIANFRNDRDNMYSELANNYSQIINNENSAPDTISQYQKKLSDLVEEKNQIMIAENIIKSKGVKEVVIVMTGNVKVSVVVNTDNLDDSLAAQIMQVVKDNLNIDMNNISIENVQM